MTRKAGSGYTECPTCHQRIIWATTQNGRKQNLNYLRDENGDIAARQDVTGTWHARTLTQGEEPHPPEHRHTHHFATSPACRPPSATTQSAATDVVTYLSDYRQERQTQ
jgi:hypothetical protein